MQKHWNMGTKGQKLRGGGTKNGVFSSRHLILDPTSSCLSMHHDHKRQDNATANHHVALKLFQIEMTNAQPCVGG